MLYCAVGMLAIFCIVCSSLVVCPMDWRRPTVFQNMVANEHSKMMWVGVSSATPQISHFGFSTIPFLNRFVRHWILPFTNNHMKSWTLVLEELHFSRSDYRSVGWVTLWWNLPTWAKSSTWHGCLNFPRFIPGFNSAMFSVVSDVPASG